MCGHGIQCGAISTEWLDRNTGIGIAFDWSRRFGADNIDRARDVAIASDGSIAVVSSFGPAIPEPASLALLSIGMLTVGVFRRGRRQE